MIRKVLHQYLEETGSEDHPLLALLPYIVGNVGLVFTNGDLKELSDIIRSNRVYHVLSGSHQHQHVQEA